MGLSSKASSQLCLEMTHESGPHKVLIHSYQKGPQNGHTQASTVNEKLMKKSSITCCLTHDNRTTSFKKTTVGIYKTTNPAKPLVNNSFTLLKAVCVTTKPVNQVSNAYLRIQALFAPNSHTFMDDQIDETIQKNKNLKK